MARVLLVIFACAEHGKRSSKWASTDSKPTINIVPLNVFEYTVIKVLNRQFRKAHSKKLALVKVV